MVCRVANGGRRAAFYESHLIRLPEDILRGEEHSLAVSGPLYYKQTSSPLSE